MMNDAKLILPAGVEERGGFVYAGDMEPSSPMGTCCACGGAERVDTVVMINRRAPIAKHGWGCFVCGMHGGASIVLCRACRRMAEVVVRFACAGYPADGRVPIESLAEPFDHDHRKHPDPDLAMLREAR